MFMNVNTLPAGFAVLRPGLFTSVYRGGKVVSTVEYMGPPPAQRNTKHARIACELRSRPQVWGVVRKPSSLDSASSAARAIREARLPAYAPPGSFEAVARSVSEGTTTEYRVYARYVGAAASAA